MRLLARLCLILLLWPELAAPTASALAATAVPVVTNISGAVALQGPSGARRDVISSQIVHSGDVLMTGINSIAILGLADIAHVRLGPATTVTTFSNGADLSLHLHSGLVCVQSDAPGTKVDAGTVSVASARKATIFNLLRNTSGTNVAVYRGQVKASVGAQTVETLNAGSAVHISGSMVTPVALKSVHSQFASLRCPDQSVVAQAESLAPKPPENIVIATPPPTNPSSGQATTNGSGGGGAPGGGGGGGGGIIGVLLGLAGLAALAGSHGGGSAGSSSGSNPSPQPSPSPSPILNVSPGNLAFTDVGSSNAQQFAITETSFSGNFAVNAGNCDNVAAISGSPFAGPSATVTVTPLNSGSCSISVADGHGGNQSVSITVGPFGALNVSTTSLSFSNLGSTDPFNAMESIYTGPIAVTSSNALVVTVSPASGAGPGPVGFIVRSQNVGNANIVVTDDHGGQQAVLASVVLGGISLSTPTLQFSGPSAEPQNFDASDVPPVVFSATTSDPSVATVTELGSSDRRASFQVTPIGTGQAAINVIDSDGGQGIVNVGVGTSPLLLKRHAATLPSAPRVKRVAPSPRPGTKPTPNAPRNIQPLQSRPLLPPNALPDLPKAAPQPELLVVSAALLSFSSGGVAQQMTATERNYAGQFSAFTSNAGVATLDQSAGPGPGPVHVFRVTPHAAGTAVLRIADDHGNVQFVQVTVLLRLVEPRIIRQSPHR